MILTAYVKSPIFKNDRYMASCHSVMYQNAGTSKVTLDGGWTLYPGGSVTLGNHSNGNRIHSKMHIEFGKVSVIPGQPLENRLEILEYHIHGQAHLDH